MSDISTIFNAFVSELATALSGHQRLTNPYDLVDNANTTLRKGYGVAVGAGENSKRLIGSKYSVTRAINVTITRQAYAKEFDISAKDTAVKNILEDYNLVIKEAAKSDNFSTGVVADRLEYVSDTGIFSVNAENHKFLAITITFETEYFEDIE